MFKAYLPHILGLILVCSVIAGIYFIKRWWNYNLGYESQVTDTICVMVKPEALINPEDCK